MGDHDSKKQQIINELMLTPQRLAELEAAKTERMWAYERLKDPDNKFKLLFDRVFDCCVMIDEKGGIVYANEAACTVLGYAKEQLLRLSAKDLYPDEQAEKMQAAAIVVLRDGVYYVGETEFIAKNGEMITVEAGAVSLKLADRSYIIYSFRDITERKHRDEKETELIWDLMSLSRTAMDLVELSTEEDIYQFIGQRLMELAGNSVIIVSSFDEESSTFCLRAIQGVGEHMDSLLEILGRHPIGISAPINKEAREGLTSGRLEKVPGGLYELASGGLPRSVCNEIETLLGLGDLYAMGFAWKGRLFGSADVLTRRGAELRNPGIIETFVSQTSVALQRWQAEVALRKAHDEVEMRGEQRTGDLADAIEKLQLEVAERKRSVEELRVKDSAIASSTNAIAISNLEGNVTYVNPSFLRLWEYESDEEVVGRPAIEFWQAWDHVDAAIETISEKEGWQGEVIALRKDGSAFVAELSASMVADGDGKPMCMMGSLLDITERKRLEEMLRESEELSRGMLEGATVGMYIVQDGNFLYVNPRFEEISGYTMAELSGADSLEHVHPDDREMVRKKATELLKGRSNTPYELRYICKDGRKLWCLERVASILYKGKPAAIGSFMDITELKRAEEALRESEERLQALIENAPEAIHIHDLNGTFIAANKKSEEIVGYSRGELASSNFIEAGILPEEYIAKAAELLEKSRRGEPTGPDELELIRKNGSRITVEISSFPVRRENRVEVVSITRDITERKRDEEAVRKSEEKHRTLLETGATPIYWIEVPSGEITFVNEKAEELFGRAGTDLLGHTVFEFMPEDEVALHQEKMQEAAREMKIEEQPIPQIIIRPSGELRYTEVYPTMFESEGKIVAQVVCPDVTERKKTEEALQESERLYRLLADNASDVIWTMDMNLQFTYVSPSFTSLLGYSFEEAIALRIEDFLTPDSVEAATNALAEAQSTEKQGEDLLKTRSVEFELLGKDGTRVWTENKMRLLLDADDQRVGILGVARNINERKRAEEALRKSEERFRALFENASDAVAILDAEGIMVYESTSVERILGYRPEELIGKSVLDLIHQDDLPEVTAKFASFLNDPTAGESMQLRLRHKDGSWRWVEGVANNLLDNPQVRGIVANYRDITDRKKADEALRDSEERFRRFVQSAPDIIFRWSVENGLEYVSPSSSRVTGFTPKELIADPMLGFEIAKGREIDITADWEKLAEERAALPPMECAFARKDGSEAYLDILSVPVVDDKGSLVAFEGILRDVTERKWAEEQLRRSEEFSSTLLANAPNPILVINPDSSVRYVNPALEELTGFTFAELIGSGSPYPWWTEETLEETGRDLADAITRGAQGLEQLCKKKNGERFWIELTSTPIMRDGELRYYLASWVDITERKRAEEALRRSEYKYRSAIESARDGILLVDNNSVILDANRTCVNAVGFDYKEQIIGRSVFDIVASEAPEEIQERVGEMLNKQGYITNVDLMACSRDGREIPVEVNISQVVDEKGRPTGAIIVIRDITERKRVQDEILRYTKSLEALHAISATVSQTLDLNEMLNSALEKVLEVIEIEAGYIHLFDKEQGELVLKAHRGVSEQHVAAVERLEVSEEAMERWHKYPEPAFGTRLILTESARQVMAPAVRQDGVAISVSVPLWSKSVMHGGLTLIGRTPRRFSPEELELLKAIGNEIAVGIENAGLLEKTRELSATDELTGLYNRRQFYDVLENEMNRMQRYGGSFTLAMLDLDSFKEYNDRFGHTNGDAVLRSLAQMLKTVLRKPDMAFRYGGDEFAIILPATDAQKAKNIVDRIRSKRLVGLKADNEGLEPCLGFSAGIAQFPENAETADGLVFLADTALYRSKRGGGNKSTLVSDLGELPADIMDSATMDQVYALAATVDARDPHTYGHSKRVATISEMIGKAIGLSIRELADLRAAALLHDIGKVGVPDSILTKPGKPEEHEWKILRKHPVEGANIVGYVKELERLVPLIRHHHEWYDGTGYPDGLKGEDIPLGARIISVADAYDTMTTSRPYRDMVSQDEASEELRRCCGTQFDHQLVDAFQRSLNETTVQAATQRSSHL